MTHLLKADVKHRRTKQQILEDKAMEVQAQVDSSKKEDHVAAMKREIETL